MFKNLNMFHSSSFLQTKTWSFYEFILISLDIKFKRSQLLYLK